MKAASQFARFEKIFAILFVIFLLFVVFVIGIDSILVVGTDILFWLLFAVVLFFSVALVVDVAYLLFKPFYKMSLIKRNITLSTWPSFEAFRRGRSDNTLEDFFVVVLRGKYLQMYGREPNRKSFGNDESMYMSFRRRVLPQAVLFSRFRPFVEDLYMKIFRLYRTKELAPELRESLEEAMRMSGRLKKPFLTTYTCIRFLLMLLSVGKLRLAKPESHFDFRESRFAENPRAFIELLDEHFFTIFTDVPNILNAQKIADEAVKKTRERYRKDVKAVGAFAPSSSPGSAKEEPKAKEQPEPEKPSSEDEKKTEERKQQEAQTPLGIAREVEEAIKKDGDYWNNIGVYLDDALARLHKVMTSANDYEHMVRIQMYRARAESFSDDLNREFSVSASKGADTSFKADWLQKAVREHGGFETGSPAFMRTARRFYIVDEAYHKKRAEEKEEEREKAEGRAS